MAQKAAKATAKRNAQVLLRTHLLALAVHATYLLLRVAIFRATLTRRSLVLYFLLSAPAVAVEIWFERCSRPKYVGPSAELRSSGEDLDAKGLTEWMWDVLYWTWGCILSAALLGDWAWWIYIVVPIYSAWLAYSTFGNARRMLSGGGEQAMGVPSGGQNGAAGGTSKRQQKMEKRGNKAQYR